MYKKLNLKGNPVHLKGKSKLNRDNTANKTGSKQLKH